MKTTKKQKQQQTTDEQDETTTTPKYIYTLAFMTLSLFILTPISQMFLRCNFVIGASLNPCDIALFAYFLYYFPYSMGQCCLSTLFLYRLHATFKRSQYSIQPRKNILIAAIFLTFSLALSFLLIFARKEFVTISTADTKYKYCANIHVDNINYVGWLGGYAVQTLYNIYILYAFIRRLYKIRETMLNCFESEKCKSAAEPTKADIVRYKRILKLNRVMIKMLFLVLCSVLFTWIYLFVGIVSIDIAYAVSYSIIIDTVCMWLLLSSITQSYWDKLVNLFYFPCLCFVICPSIKDCDENDMKHLIKKHIEMNSRGSEETSEMVVTVTADMAGAVDV